MNLEEITQLLQQNRFFGGVLAAHEVLWLSERLRVADFEAGEPVLEAGDQGKGLFLIAAGKAQVIDQEESGKLIVLATLTRGDLFGERSLLEDIPVSKTVQAAESLRLLELTADDFATLIAGSPELVEQFEERIRQYTEFNFLRNLNILSGLNRLEIQALIQSIKKETLPPGAFLFHEGDPGDAVYILREGSIRIIKQSASDAVLSELKAGAILGEMALVDNQPRTAAAQTIDHTTLLKLTKQDYDRIASRGSIVDSIKKQAAQRLMQQDALIYSADSADSRHAILDVLRQPNGIELFWQRVKQDRQLPEQALKSLGKVSGLEVLAPSPNLMTDTELARSVPRQYAESNRVLPIYATEDDVEVLVTTPFLGTLPAELEKMLNRRISLRITTPPFLDKLIERTYEGEGLEGSFTDLENADNWDEFDSVEDLKDQAQAAPIIKLVNNIFVEAIGRKASDIHIDPSEEGLDVRYRVDGILQAVSTTPRRFQAAIVSRIKIMANLDIAERRIPQDGRISLRLEGKSFDIRVASIPTVYGEGVVMRILDKASVQVSIEDVGFTPEMLAQWETLIHRSTGVVLVTGPTGSGKTTTLYATLNRIKTAELKIITAEDPVEYQLQGIEQVQINPKVGLTFAATLRSMLRLDPDIIMVGEVRDGETAEIAIQSALTGHLVFSTLHTNDAATTLTRLVEMDIEPYLVGSAVNGALAQRLVRKLCPACKTQDASGQWQAAGCNQCGNSGYRGRLGIYELLIIDDALREMLANKVDANQLAAAARQSGMLSLYEDGMLKAAQGLTTESEVHRVAG